MNSFGYDHLVSNHMLRDRELAAAKQPEEQVYPLLTKVLDAIKAKRMIAGHTITDTAGFACTGRGGRALRR